MDNENDLQTIEEELEYISEKELETEEKSDYDEINEEDPTSLTTSEDSFDTAASAAPMDSFLEFQDTYSSIHTFTISNDQEDIQEEQDIADIIIQAFSKKQRVNFIDSDPADALISYQESEIRLIILEIVTAFILAIVSSTFLIHFLSDKESPIIVHQPTLDDGHYIPIPRISIMNPESGQIQFFYLEKGGLKFQQVWTLKVPQSQTYFVFYHNKYLNVIYSDIRKDITHINIHEKSHKVIQNSAIPLDYQLHKAGEISTGLQSYGTSVARLGEWIWIFGGNRNSEIPGLNSPTNYHQTCLWSLRKQKWIIGPHLEDNVQYGKLIHFNQTYALLLFPNLTNYPSKHCIKAYSISFHLNFSDPLIPLNDCYFDYESSTELDASMWIESDHFDAKSYVMKNKVVNWLVVVGVQNESKKNNM